MTFGDGSGVYEHIGNLDRSGADGLVKASIDAGINDELARRRSAPFSV